MPAKILTQPAVDYHARCCTFCAAIFAAVRERFSAYSSLEDALEEWNDSMCNLRSMDRKKFFTTLGAEHMTYYKEGQANDDMYGFKIMLCA